MLKKDTEIKVKNLEETKEGNIKVIFENRVSSISGTELLKITNNVFNSLLHNMGIIDNADASRIKAALRVAVSTGYSVRALEDKSSLKTAFEAMCKGFDIPCNVENFDKDHFTPEYIQEFCKDYKKIIFSSTLDKMTGNIRSAE